MKVLLILGGEAPAAELVRFWYERSDLRLAADSGFLAYQTAGLVPDKLTGDFDSLGIHWRNLSCEVIHRPEQTATDFEKALDLIPAEASDLILLGGTGGRLDHCLTNLLIASRLPESWQVSFVSEDHLLARVTATVQFVQPVSPGSIVSLIPFNRASGVTTSGLRWNLYDSEMAADAQLGQSNLAEEDTVQAAIRSGCLFVYVQPSAPNNLSR